MAEPDIYVERCFECPARKYMSRSTMVCKFIRRMRASPDDRRFPRWCPLLKQPITVAAIQKEK